MNESVRELQERYVLAVTQLLPRALRADVGQELRTLLEETVRGRSQETGREPDRFMTLQILRDFGSPEEVAQRYAPRPQWLIGPTFYPAFLLVLKVIPASFAGIAVLLLFISYFFGPQGAIPRLEAAEVWRWLQLYVQMVWGALAWAVLVFAVLERILKGNPFKTEEWDPNSLPPLDKEDQVSQTGLTLGIYGIILLLVWLNLFPQWVGIVMVQEGRGPVWVSLIDMGIVLPMLLINLWFLAALFRNLLLLSRRRWDPVGLWYDFGLTVFSAVVWGKMFADIPGQLDPARINSVIGLEVLARLVTKGIPVVILAVFLLAVGSAGIKLFRLLRPANRPEIAPSGNS